MAKFRNVEFQMYRGKGYGQYIIKANYKGKDVVAHTTDSEAWDYLNDDSDKEKHLSAKRHCYYKIVDTYKKISLCI